MKILVTGGAGFIGSHVAQVFVEAGHEVVVLDDLSTGVRGNVPPGARLVEMDVTSPDVAGFLAAERFQVIDHHAAQISVPSSVEDPSRDARVNILGLLNLLEQGRRHGLQRFINISSGGAVYGEMLDPPVNEDHPARPLSPYAVSKLAGEMYVNYYAAQYEIKGISLRYANVYGPRQIPQGEAGVAAIFMDAVITGKSPVIFRHPDMPRGMVRDYVFVEDCARANLAALTAPSGSFNIGTGKGTHTLELWNAVLRAAGRDIPHSFGPHRQGDIKNSVLDSSLAKRVLDWEPRVNLDQGLSLTREWRLGLDRIN